MITSVLHRKRVNTCGLICWLQHWKFWKLDTPLRTLLTFSIRQSITLFTFFIKMVLKLFYWRLHPGPETSSKSLTSNSFKSNLSEKQFTLYPIPLKSTKSLFSFGSASLTYLPCTFVTCSLWKHFFIARILSYILKLHTLYISAQ